MFRLNAQYTTQAVITAGAGIPGGTGMILFSDSANDGTLKAVMPDGTVRTATVGGVAVLIKP